MSWNPIWEFRLSAKFWCKFSPLLCSARSKSDHFPTREQVVPHWGSGVRVFSTAKHIPRKEHSHIRAMYYWVRLGFITFSYISRYFFSGLPTDAERLNMSFFTHIILGSISQLQPIVMQTFAWTVRKCEQQNWRLRLCDCFFTTASRTRELNLASLQMHIGGSVTVDININTNFNILVTLQMMGQSGSVPLE